MSEVKKILISVPISPYSYIEPDLCTWLIKTIIHFNFQNPGRYVLSYDFVEGKPIDSVRNRIVNNFIKSECDYLLTIDNDIVPPDNCITELMQWNKDIVGALCFSWQYKSPFPVILDKVKNGYSIVKDLGKQRLQECKATGASCMIIKREVVLKMKENLLKKTKKTMFYETKYRENGEIGWGQDFIFCENALELGYKIYVDTQIKCAHKVSRLDLATINDLMCKQQNGHIAIVKKFEKAIDDLTVALTEEKVKNNGHTSNINKQTPVEV